MKEIRGFAIKHVDSNRIFKLYYQPRAFMSLYVSLKKHIAISLTTPALMKLKLWHTSCSHYHGYDVQQIHTF